MNKWIPFLLLTIFFFSCEKNISLVPETQEPKLVVDAQIETGQSPVVILTNSINYFSEINSNLLMGSFVHNAKVTISDGVKTHQLKEYNIPVGGATYFFYANDFTNPATAITGENGKQYSLTIEANGKTYNSSTNIPLPLKKIDSIWWKKPPVYVDTTFAIVMAKITDPKGLGNYIRYFTRNRNNSIFLPGENSVFDDQVIDGKTYDIPITAGIDRNKPRTSFDSTGYFLRGDTVTIKLCNIDKSSYTFWNTWEFAYQSIGNPFSSPVKVIGNISNNALGAFSGYSVQLKTVIIPK